MPKVNKTGKVVKVINSIPRKSSRKAMIAKIPDKKERKKENGICCSAGKATKTTKPSVRISERPAKRVFLFTTDPEAVIKRLPQFQNLNKCFERHQDPPKPDVD